MPFYPELGKGDWIFPNLHSRCCCWLTLAQFQFAGPEVRGQCDAQIPNCCAGVLIQFKTAILWWMLELLDGFVGFTNCTYTWDQGDKGSLRWSSINLLHHVFIKYSVVALIFNPEKKYLSLFYFNATIKPLVFYPFIQTLLFAFWMKDINRPILPQWKVEHLSWLHKVHKWDSRAEAIKIKNA